MSAIMSVSIRPGDTALTRTFCLRKFTRQRPRQAQQAGLRCGVTGLTDPADVAARRHDIDDSSPAAQQHLAHHGPNAQEGAAEIGRDDIVPAFALHVDHEAVARDAGVVDEHIDRSELASHAAEECVDRHFVRDVASLGERSDVPLLDQRDGFPGSVVALPVADRDGRTAIGERDSDRAADAARAASHDGDTAFETQVHESSDDTLRPFAALSLYRTRSDHDAVVRPAAGH